MVTLTHLLGSSCDPAPGPGHQLLINTTVFVFTREHSPQQQDGSTINLTARALCLVFYNVNIFDVSAANW